MMHAKEQALKINEKKIIKAAQQHISGYLQLSLVYSP